MATWSVSQNRFIDGNSQQTGGQSSAVPTDTSNGRTTSQDPMAQLFAALMLKKKDYSGAYDLLNPKVDPALVKIQTEQRKAQKSVTPLLQLSDIQEKNFQEAGGGATNVPILSNLIGVKQNIEGALNFNPSAKLYNDSKQAFIASTKGLTGDVGVLTDQDARRLSMMYPSFGDSNTVASKKFQQIRDFISSKYDSPSTQSTYKNTSNAGQQLTPELYKYLTTETGKLQQSQASRPKVKAGDLMGALGTIPGSLSDIGMVMKDAVAPAIETAGNIEGAKSVISGVRSIPKLISGITGGGASAARATASKGVNVETKALIDAGDNYVKNIDPGAIKAWETLKPSIKSTTSMEELLTKLTNWQDKAFTASGDKKAIAEGLLKAHLADKGRNIIQEQAPNIAALTSQMSKGIRNKALLQKAGWYAGGSAIGAATYALLGKLLNQNQP